MIRSRGEFQLRMGLTQTRHRALAIGILVGLVFLFRQLTAVFVAMGVLAFLFTEERAVPPDSLNRGFGVARAVLGLMVVGLLGYLVRSTDFSAGILFGLWPLLILGWAFRRPKMPNRAAVRLLAWLGVGAVISALPLIGYHLLHGSLGAWTRDVFIRSLSVTGLEHIQVGRYVSTVILAFMTPAMSLTLAAVPNALYWMALVFAAFLAGAKLFHRVRVYPRQLACRRHWPCLSSESSTRWFQFSIRSTTTCTCPLACRSSRFSG